MPELSNISEKEIEDTIMFIIEQLPSFLSKLSVGEMELQLNESDKKEMREQLPENLTKSLQIAKQIENLKTEPILEKEKILRFYNLINELLHLTNAVPPEQDWLDFSIGELGLVFSIPTNLGYLKNTKYLEYISVINKLALKLCYEGKYPAVKSFFSNVSTIDDEYIILQGFFNCTVNNYMYLQEGQEQNYIRKIRLLLLSANYRIISKSQINKYIDIYSDLAGHYEKYLRVLVGLLEILEGKTPDYSKIRGRRLSINLKTVGNECNILTEDFNVHIRNSIVHKSFILDQANESIEFIDIKDKIQISYPDFSNKVKELSALVLALFLMGDIMKLNNFLNFKKRLTDYGIQDGIGFTEGR